MNQKQIARLLVLSASLLCPLAGRTQNAQMHADELQKKLQARLQELQEAGGYPGLTAAIVMPDGQVVSAAAGWADAERKILMQPSDRMPAGSVGKTFVAAVILQAVDDGQLDLDSKIERWLGHEAWFGRLPNAHDLTLRLLLSHRSGIPDNVTEKEFPHAAISNLEKDWTPQELIGWVLDKKPLFPAGKKYYYTDINYTVAGMVFETATGRKLFGEVERRIVKPFGLDQTLPSESRSMKDVVPGELDPSYLKLKGQTIRDGHFVYNIQIEYAGGGMISTSRDLARWAKLLWEGKVFSPAMLQQMLDAKPDEKGFKYGLGVAVAQSEAGTAYEHDGQIPGYQTAIIYFPDYKIAAAVQMNADQLKRFKVPFEKCIGRVAGVALKDRLPKKPLPSN
ncbi:MAG TPA: serine hydrolase domain-containing protein [Candidatus Angelobacter sp.]|nr:serine hydrolase domain-containing protein [Candidatus Angelobacter sp.]